MLLLMFFLCSQQFQNNIQHIYKYNLMLTFPVQQKILGDILKNSSNLHCADCLSKSPTWASLDFGVFLCSNCAGAHRALGPTVTRVRSANLDTWNKEWVQNMRIGNVQLNKYWENDSSHTLMKPKSGASLQQINRYIVQKYIKKKYANEGKHPLQAYKAGEYVLLQNGDNSNNSAKDKQIFPSVKKENDANIVKLTQKPNIEVIINPKPIKFEGNLLQLDHQQQKKCQQHQDDEEQFTQYHSAETHHQNLGEHTNNNTHMHTQAHSQTQNSHQTHQTRQTHQIPHDPSNIKYEDLFKVKVNNPQQLSDQNITQNHHLAQNVHAPTYNNQSHHFNQVNINGHSYYNQQNVHYQNVPTTSFGVGYQNHSNGYSQFNQHAGYNPQMGNSGSMHNGFSNNINLNQNKNQVYSQQQLVNQSNWTL